MSQTVGCFVPRKIFQVMQLGYRNAHGTRSVMAKILEDIVKAYDVGKISALVLLDLSKTFDLVNPRLLCAKLLGGS